MNGLRSVAGALLRRAAVTALTLGSVLVVAVPDSSPVAAYNGGTSYTSPAAQPCVAPCQFDGDNTGAGLNGFPYNGYGNYNATWWVFTPTESKTYTFRASSTNPIGWDNTLTLTTDTGDVVAHNDDNYNLDAMISALLTAGTPYRLALAGYSIGSVGVARISISASAPNAPTLVAGTEGDGNVALTWTAPFDNYAPITAYRVYVNGGPGFTEITGTPPTAGTTITGLTNGSPYTFRVSAVNANGEGPKSTATGEYVPYGATTTTIAFSPTNPTFGSSFDVVVTVHGSSAVDSGQVTLYRGATSLGTHAVVDSTATWTGESRPVGPQNYRADFVGFPAWTASSSGQVPVVTGKAAQTITFTQPADTAHAAGTITVAPTASSGDTVVVTSNTTPVCTVTNFTVTLVTGGTCTLTASEDGNDNYLAAPDVVRSFQVTAAPQTITFTRPADTAHATGTITVAPTASSGDTVVVTSNTTSVCTVTNFTITLVTGGTCTLTASEDGNANFAEATSVTRNFQITAAPQTITFTRPADRTWSATTFDLAPTASSELATVLTSDTTDVCTVSTFTVTMVRTGTCTLTAAQAGNTNFVAASQQRSFDITRAAQAALAATAGSYELTIGDTTDVSATGGSGDGAVTYSVTSGADHCSVAGTTLSATATGTCVVTASKAADTRYASASAETSVITVAKATPTIAIAGTATVQAGNTTTVTVTVTGLIAGHTPGSISLQLSGTTAGALASPGTASLTLAGNGTSGTATFTITAGESGVLDVDARLTATDAYEQADTPDPVVLTVTPIPVTPIPVTPIPAALIPTVPSRIIDTRPGYPHVRPAPDVALAAGEVLEVQFTDLPGLVPANGVNAVALDIGVTAPLGDGFITAYPCGERPVVSSLNFRAGQTISNAAIVPVNDISGAVCFYASQSAHLIVDVTGWFATGNGFVDVSPRRLVDTRPGTEAIRPLTDPFTLGEAREVTATGIEGLVPSQGVAAVSLNLTVVNPGAAGYVSAYACGERPNASSVNFSAGRTVANLAIVPVSDRGSVCFYASQPLHLIVDVNGWFQVGQGFDAVGPSRVFDTRPGYTGLRTVASERIGDAQMLTVQVTDLVDLVPAVGVGAVSLNVTAIDPAADGFLTVWACGTRPDASSLNYGAHHTTAGAVIAPVDPATGTVCFYSSQSVHLAVDVNGWFIGNIA